MGRKCVLKDGHNYSTGVATYQSEFGAAMIYDYDELEDWQKSGHVEYDGWSSSYPQREIIFLDTERGLTLLAEEIETLERKIELAESRLEMDKRNYEKIRNAVPHLTDEYVKRHNKRYHPLIGISGNDKRMIIENIIKENDE